MQPLWTYAAWQDLADGVDGAFVGITQWESESEHAHDDFRQSEQAMRWARQSNPKRERGANGSAQGHIGSRGPFAEVDSGDNPRGSSK
jgi:hypothetical protein